MTATPQETVRYTGSPSATKGLSNSRGGMLGNVVGFAFVRDPVAEHDELVASDPGNEVQGPASRGEPAGGLDEQPVARGMAESVVHHLEAVEVDGEDRTEALVAPVAVDDEVEPGRQHLPVGEPRQRVAPRLVPEGFLAPFPAGDVLHLAEVVGHAVIAMDRRNLDEGRHDRPVGTDEVSLTLVSGSRRGPTPAGPGVLPGPPRAGTRRAGGRAAPPRRARATGTTPG